MNLGAILAVALQAYVVAIIVWVAASWIPGARTRLRPLGKLTEPYLELFRFIRPIGGVDISPIVAIMLLQLLAGWLGGARL